MFWPTKTTITNKRHKKAPDATPDVCGHHPGWVSLDDYRVSFEALAVTLLYNRSSALLKGVTSY